MKKAISIYSKEQYLSLKDNADVFILPCYKFNTIYINDDYNNILNLMLNDKKEIILSIDKIYLENEISELKVFLNKYKDYDVKYLVSDLGVSNILKEMNLINKTIFDPKTMICNPLDLKCYYQLGFNALSLSNEIPLDDILNIYEESKIPLFYQVFGRKIMFYSKRKLFSLYKEHKGIKGEFSDLSLKEELRDYHLPLIENVNGTFIFRNGVISYLENISKLHFLNYFYFESYAIEDEKMKKVLTIFDEYFNHKKDLDILKKEFDELGFEINDQFINNDTSYVKEEINGKI